MDSDLLYDARVSTPRSNILCDPHRGVHRWVVLIFICFLSFGSYFVFDNPAALQDVMLPTLNITLSQYSGFYSVYSWPNVVLSVFGGLLIDTVLGLRLGGIVFAILVTSGQLIFATGGYLKSYWLMMAGRFVFGLGGENLAVAQNLYSVAWFRGQELTFIMGLQMCFARVGSTVNLNVMSPIYHAVANAVSEDYHALGLTLYIGAVMCFLSLTCALLLAYFDKRRRRMLNTLEVKRRPKCADFLEIKKVAHFPGTFWLLCAICVFFYVTIFPYISFAQVFFEMKFQYGSTKADLVNSMVYFVSMAASPIAGYCIDLTGKNIWWMIVGCISAMACHVLLGFTFISPFITMTCLGIALSVLAASLWPAVAYILPEKDQGTGYGVMQSIQNFGLAIIPLVEAQVVNNYGYIMLSVLMILMQIAALVACIVLYFVDKSTGSKVNATAKQRKADFANKAE